jgi:hypothetical protein
LRHRARRPKRHRGVRGQPVAQAEPDEPSAGHSAQRFTKPRNPIMQHIVLDTTFEFSPKPFPAFRGNLVFGRNKFDRIFVGTKVEPVQYWRVRPDTYDDVTPLLVTADRAAAETAKAAYDVEGHTRPDLCGTSFVPCRARIEEDGPPRLMRDTFRVIKTREKGTILIVPGEDTTPRALACIGAASRGFRGGVSVIECTATKLGRQRMLVAPRYHGHLSARGLRGVSRDRTSRERRHGVHVGWRRHATRAIHVGGVALAWTAVDDSGGERDTLIPLSVASS